MSVSEHSASPRKGRKVITPTLETFATSSEGTRQPRAGTPISAPAQLLSKPTFHNFLPFGGRERILRVELICPQEQERAGSLYASDLFSSLFFWEENETPAGGDKPGLLWGSHCSGGPLPWGPFRRSQPPARTSEGSRPFSPRRL